MRAMHKILTGCVVLVTAAALTRSAPGTEKPPQIQSLSVPLAGSIELLLHGNSGGPFLIQTRATLDPSSPWVDLPNAVVTELQPGVYMGYVPNNRNTDLSFYRIL